MGEWHALRLQERAAVGCNIEQIERKYGLPAGMLIAGNLADWGSRCANSLRGVAYFAWRARAT